MVAVASLLLTGCITYMTEIRLRGDGSGTMVVTMTTNPQQMKELMRGIAKQTGATLTESKNDGTPDAQKATAKTPEPSPFNFNMSKFKGRAASLGQGVTFVSAEKIDTKTAAGVRVTYAFKDINQLAVNQKPGAASGTAGAGASAKDALKFRFKRLPNGNALLTILLPPHKPTPRQQPAVPPSLETSAKQAAMGTLQTGMATQMFKGLHIGVAVDVAGTIVRTNSPYVDGSKVTLMDIDVDHLVPNEQGFNKLSEKMGAAKGDYLKTMEVLKEIKGIKITTKPEISIEFTPE